MRMTDRRPGIGRENRAAASFPRADCVSRRAGLSFLEPRSCAPHTC